MTNPSDLVRDELPGDPVPATWVTATAESGTPAVASAASRSWAPWRGEAPVSTSRAESLPATRAMFTPAGSTAATQIRSASGRKTGAAVMGRA